MDIFRRLRSGYPKKSSAPYQAVEYSHPSEFKYRGPDDLWKTESHELPEGSWERATSPLSGEIYELDATETQSQPTHEAHSELPADSPEKKADELYRATRALVTGNNPPEHIDEIVSSAKSALNEYHNDLGRWKNLQNWLALGLLQQGNFQEVISRTRETLTILPKDDPASLPFHYHLVLAQTGAGDPQAAIKTADDTLKKFTTNPSVDPQDLQSLRHAKALAAHDAQNYPLFLQSVEEAIAWHKKSSDTVAENSHQNIEMANLRLLRAQTINQLENPEDPKKGLEVVQEIDEIFSIFDRYNSSYRGRASVERSFAYHHSRQDEKAFSEANTALELTEKGSNAYEEATVARSIAHFRLMERRGLSNDAKTREYIENAQKSASKSLGILIANDSPHIADVCDHLFHVNKRLNTFQDYLQSTEASIGPLKKNASPFLPALHTNRATFHDRCKNYTQAIDEADSALRMLDDESPYRGKALFARSVAYNHLENHDRALDDIVKAIPIIQKSSHSLLGEACTHAVALCDFLNRPQQLLDSSNSVVSILDATHRVTPNSSAPLPPFLENIHVKRITAQHRLEHHQQLLDESDVILSHLQANPHLRGFIGALRSNAQVRLGNHEAAIAEAEATIQVLHETPSPYLGEAYLHKAIAHNARQEWGLALNAAQMASRSPSHTEQDLAHSIQQRIKQQRSLALIALSPHSPSASRNSGVGRA